MKFLVKSKLEGSYPFASSKTTSWTSKVLTNYLLGPPGKLHDDEQEEEEEDNDDGDGDDVSSCDKFRDMLKKISKDMKAQGETLKMLKELLAQPDRDLRENFLPKSVSDLFASSSTGYKQVIKKVTFLFLIPSRPSILILRLL